MATNIASLLQLIKDKAPLEEVKATLSSLTDRGELLSKLTEKDDRGLTPLHHAIANASPEVLKTVFDLNSDVPMLTLLLKTNIRLQSFFCILTRVWEIAGIG